MSSRRYKNFNEYIEAVKELITSYDDVIAVEELEEFEVPLFSLTDLDSTSLNTSG